MSFKQFVPTVWSAAIMRENEKSLVLAPLMNREYEGSISSKGDRVKILGIGKPTIGDYVPENGIADPEELADTSVFLDIDKAPYFNVSIDDIDKRQTQGVMSAITQECSEAMSEKEDANIGITMRDGIGSNSIISIADLTVANVRQYISKAKVKLHKNGVGKNANIVLACTPEFEGIVTQAVENIDTNNSSTVKNGWVGKTGGVSIYVSNNLPQSNDKSKDICFMFTANRAVAHASQVNQIVPYAPEGNFSDAIKGLNLHGTKVVRPKEIVAMHIAKYEDEAVTSRVVGPATK